MTDEERAADKRIRHAVKQARYEARKSAERAVARQATGQSRQFELAWVAEHLEEEIGPKAAPSRVAFGLYKWARKKDENARIFMSMYFKMVLKEKMDDQQSQKDEERTIKRLYEVLERERPQHSARVERSRQAPREPADAASQAQVQA